MKTAIASDVKFKINFPRQMLSMENVVSLRGSIGQNDLVVPRLMNFLVVLVFKDLQLTHRRVVIFLSRTRHCVSIVKQWRDMAIV